MTLRLPLLALLPAMLLAGCGGTTNRGVESVHQPVVRHADYVFDLATDGGLLAPGEGQRLAGWLASLNLGFGDSVAVDDGGADGAARDQVAAQVSRYGLMLADRAPITAGPGQPGTVRVVVSRMVAGVPGCGDYSRMYVPDYSSDTSSNYGCAINGNLAAMIARPEDLVRGQRAVGPNDPAVSAKAIDTYRKTANSGSGGLKSAGTGGQ